VFTCQIPSAKEFKKATESMSPEQQVFSFHLLSFILKRFSKAYRSLQLSATLFGIVIIHTTPQLERLLNLPFDSLKQGIWISLVPLTNRNHITTRFNGIIPQLPHPK
jgi:hypothetical protein